jgi:hypothetical protein
VSRADAGSRPDSELLAGQKSPTVDLRSEFAREQLDLDDQFARIKTAHPSGPVKHEGDRHQKGLAVAGVGLSSGSSVSEAAVGRVTDQTEVNRGEPDVNDQFIVVENVSTASKSALSAGDRPMITGSNVPVAEIDPPPVQDSPLFNVHKASDPGQSKTFLEAASESPRRNRPPYYEQSGRTPPDVASIAALLQRARALLTLGDVSAAQLFLKRAAELGSVEARAELQRLSPGNGVLRPRL